MRRIYVASSWRNTQQPEVVQTLRDLGHTVYDFKGPGDGWGGTGSGPGGFGWSELDPAWQAWTPEAYVYALNKPRAIEGFNRDMDALRSSNFCLMVMPCGPSASMEMGWACGAGIPTVVYVPGMREPDLMVKMANVVTHTWADVAAYLEGLDRA